MGNSMILILFLCIVIPLSLMAVIFGRKTRRTFIFIVIGTYMCIICGSLNSYFRTVMETDTFYLTTTITPIVEETIKSIPIFIYALFFSDKKENVLNASAALGLGFALLENIYIITGSSQTPTIAWALARSFGAGMVHCGCGVIVGYGMIFIRSAKKFFVPNIFALISTAIIYHGIFNALTSTDVYWLGPIITLLVFAVLVVVHLRERATGNMREEFVVDTPKRAKIKTQNEERN